VLGEGGVVVEMREARWGDFKGREGVGLRASSRWGGGWGGMLRKAARAGW